MNLSFWEQDTYFRDVDVAIIGSGIVGLSTAYYLKKKNKKLRVIILERGMLPLGASSRNAGFACFGSPSELLEDLKHHSEDEVFSLVEKRWKGLQKLRKNLGDKEMDLRNYGGYEVFSTKKEFDPCSEQLAYLNQRLAPVIGKKNIYKNADAQIKSFGFRHVKHMILNSAESQIDTGKMISALIRKVRDLGVEIVNGFDVKSMEDQGDQVHIVSSEGIQFNTRSAIVATNGFARQLLPGYPVIPARAQVLITKPIKGLKLKGAFHYEGGYYYFRNIGNRVLFGGGRNLDFRTEETTAFGLTQLVQTRLEKMLDTMILPYTDYEIEQRWSGIMGVGPTKKSIVKSVSKNVYCAVRMGGMGIAVGSLVGEEVAKMAEENL